MDEGEVKRGEAGDEGYKIARRGRSVGKRRSREDNDRVEMGTRDRLKESGRGAGGSWRGWAEGERGGGRMEGEK